MPKLTRVLSIYDQGNSCIILDGKDGDPLYKVNLSRRLQPHVTLVHISGTEDSVGSASYQVTKRHFSTVTNISLDIPSVSGSITLNEKGGFFNSTRRVLCTQALGRVKFDSRVGSNPWKGGANETTFIKCTNEAGRTLMVFRDERYDIKRLGHLEIVTELNTNEIDQAVLGTIAVLFAERRDWI